MYILISLFYTTKYHECARFKTFERGKSHQFLYNPNRLFFFEHNSLPCLFQQPKHYENHRLFCDYFTNGDPGLLLQPIRREVQSLQPYVVLYHNFITDKEAEDIKALSQQGVSNKFTIITPTPAKIARNTAAKGVAER